MKKYIKSPINYIGNKYKLISQIEPVFPQSIDTFVDLFGGSGTVLINADAKRYVYNDNNRYVSSIFKGVLRQSAEETIQQIEDIISEYQLSMTNEAGFLKLRDDYNNGRKDWITLYTLMSHSFNHQFRFNNKHEYNSSFGRNRSYFSDRQKSDLLAMKVQMSGAVTFLSRDFRDIDLYNLGADDFVYLDPPYLNSIGNYNDGKRGFEGWTAEHELDLLYTIDVLHKHSVRFALSNNLKYANKYLMDWLDKKSYTIRYLKGDYVNCNYHKIDRSKDIEVLITNY